MCCAIPSFLGDFEFSHSLGACPRIAHKIRIHAVNKSLISSKVLIISVIFAMYSLNFTFPRLFNPILPIWRGLSPIFQIPGEPVP
jgi:hypothetical protein